MSKIQQMRSTGVNDTKSETDKESRAVAFEVVVKPTNSADICHHTSVRNKSSEIEKRCWVARIQIR